MASDLTLFDHVSTSRETCHGREPESFSCACWGPSCSPGFFWPGGPSGDLLQMPCKAHPPWSQLSLVLHVLTLPLPPVLMISALRHDQSLRGLSCSFWSRSLGNGMRCSELVETPGARGGNHCPLCTGEVSHWVLVPGAS